MAETVSAAYPGCKVHRVQALDAGGVELWVVSVADVWTQGRAEADWQSLVAMGVGGVVHQVRIIGDEKG